MRAVNLIPPEDRRGDRAPLRSGPLAYVLVGVLLLAFAGVYAVVSTGNSISESEAEAAALEQELASAEARAQALQSFSGFASLEQARTETVASLARSRFDWERILRELALVIPGDVSLLTLSGSITGEPAGDTGAAAAGGETIAAPALFMTGCATGHESVARMLSALRDIDGVTRVGLASSSRSGGEIADDAGGAGACMGAKANSFDVTVAFDEVEVDPEGGIVPAPESADAADGSGIAEASAGRERAQDSVESAQQESDDAVETFVPGA